MFKRTSTLMVAGMLAAGSGFAGGNPEFVPFPTGYADSFENYVTMNRVGKELVAKMWANDVAVQSYRAGGNAAPGSVIIMEIYKPQQDAQGKPLVGDDGVYQSGKLAAVAVMRRSDQWDAEFAASDRLEGWGFAIFNPDGTPKQNDLECVECHKPLATQDYVFTVQPLKEYAARRQ